MENLLCVRLALFRRPLAQTGLEVIAASSRRAGHPASVVYGPLLSPENVEDMGFSTGLAAIYSPVYYDVSIPQFAMQLTDAERSDIRVLRPHNKTIFTPIDYTIKKYIRSINSAKKTVQLIVAEILAREPELVGISVTLDQQKMGAAAIARVLRSSGYCGPLVAGGAALDGRVPFAFMSCFTEFDFALVGEADLSWLQLVTQLEEKQDDHSTVPGIIYRRNGRVIRGAAEQPVVDLNKCAVPDYTEYMH